MMKKVKKPPLCIYICKTAIYKSYRNCSVKKIPAKFSRDLFIMILVAVLPAMMTPVAVMIAMVVMIVTTANAYTRPYYNLRLGAYEGECHNNSKHH
jgi:hypothetical protein